MMMTIMMMMAILEMSMFDMNHDGDHHAPMMLRLMIMMIMVIVMIIMVVVMMPRMLEMMPMPRTIDDDDNASNESDRYE
jgi:hypothetical protein